MNTIQFPYIRDGIVVNVKYRDGAKNFKMHKDAELIFYNLDSIKDFDEVYIVEGEIDCMTLHQCGITNVISVPNGANLNTNNFQYIDNSYDQLSHIKKFHIAVDNDVAGRKLREDLANRFGIEKCDYIVFKTFKDANECMVNTNYQSVVESCLERIFFPIEGVFTISDYSTEIDDYYKNGLPVGAKIGMNEFDSKCSFHKGYLTVITGIPSHGKTSFLDQIILRLSLMHKWKTAFYSPENRPTKLHISKMARMLVNKPWDGLNRMSETELEMCKIYLNEEIFFIKPEQDFTLDSILTRVEDIQRRWGCDAFVIDAWNKLEHKDDSTNYIGQQLDKIVEFCERRNIHCFLVVHPTKMRKQRDDPNKYEIPTLYDASGSANFYNKADIGLCVYRNFEDETVDIYIQKVKFNHWGETGFVTLTYDKSSGRYYESLTDPSFRKNWIEEFCV